MYSLYRGSTDLHNEATKSRQKRDNNDESSLLPLSWDSVCSHLYHIQLRCKPCYETPSNRGDPIITKRMCTKVIEQQVVKKIGQNRLIVAEQCDKPDVSICERVLKNNAPSFATLYQVVKHKKGQTPENCNEGRHKCPPTANYFL